MTSVFLSYPQSLFRSFIEDLKLELRKDGVQPVDCNDPESRYHEEAREDSRPAQIRRAGLFVSFLLEDNPNLFFELGIAIGQQKPVLVIAGYKNDFPSFAQNLELRRIDSLSFETIREVASWVRQNAPDEQVFAKRFTDLRSVVRAARKDAFVWDMLPPNDFEELVANWFAAHNMVVEMNSPGYEYGYEMVLRGYKGQRRTLVQLKKYSLHSKVSIAQVQQLLGAMHMYSADGGILISTAAFTRSAIDFAEKCAPPIELMSPDDLVNAFDHSA